MARTFLHHRLQTNWKLDTLQKLFCFHCFLLTTVPLLLVFPSVVKSNFRALTLLTLPHIRIGSFSLKRILNRLWDEFAQNKPHRTFTSKSEKTAAVSMAPAYSSSLLSTLKCFLAVTFTYIHSMYALYTLHTYVYLDGETPR